MADEKKAPAKAPAKEEAKEPDTTSGETNVEVSSSGDGVVRAGGNPGTSNVTAPSETLVRADGLVGVDADQRLPAHVTGVGESKETAGVVKVADMAATKHVSS